MCSSYSFISKLHSKDLHAGNLLIGIEDESQLSEFEEAEIARPSSRKLVDGVAIHVSQFMLESFGPLYLCDLGEARVGSQHDGIAMPIQYRAPEIILGMSWGHAVDMWSVGLLVRLTLPASCLHTQTSNGLFICQAWDLLEPESLFHLYDADDPARNEAYHLANMTALLGPPPSEFLARSSKSREYWDENGKANDLCSVSDSHADNVSFF